MSQSTPCWVERRRRKFLATAPPPALTSHKALDSSGRSTHLLTGLRMGMKGCERMYVADQNSNWLCSLPQIDVPSSDVSRCLLCGPQVEIHQKWRDAVGPDFPLMIDCCKHCTAH